MIPTAIAIGVVNLLLLWWFIRTLSIIRQLLEMIAQRTANIEKVARKATGQNLRDDAGG